MTLSRTHTKATTQHRHLFLLLFKSSEWQLWSDEGGKGTKTWNTMISNTSFSLSSGKKLHHYVIFVMCSSTGVETSFVIFRSDGKSDFRESSWAVSILCCQVEQLKEGSKHIGPMRLLGASAKAEGRNPRKELPFLGIPIQFVGAVYQVSMQTGCKYAT